MELVSSAVVCMQAVDQSKPTLRIFSHDPERIDL